MQTRRPGGRKCFTVSVSEAKVFSFDIGQFEYTKGNAKLMKSLFPERFEYISGPSAETVKAFGEERP